MDSRVGAEVAEQNDDRGGRDRAFGDGADDRMDDASDAVRTGDDARSDDERDHERTPLEAFAAALASVPATAWITLVVVGACVVLVTTVLQPEWIRRDTIPTGGDMGAHVWSPAYLRDHLLPHGKLVGWTPDWYAGFPAFQFYMVVPSLAIVALNGYVPFAVAAAVVALTLVALAFRARRREHRARLIVGASIATAVALVCAIGMPYGVAFKLVVVSGLVSLPVSAWALGRCAGLAYPGPALMAVATVPFLFDRSFNIYGGNIASTMAGEFAFSTSLSLSVLALALTVRALETGRGRGWAALVFALAGLCHIFPAVFAAAAALIYFVLRVGRTQLVTVATVFPVAGLLGAFWALPFFWKRTYLNDMGWEKLTLFKSYLVTRNTLNPAETLRDSPPLEVVLTMAVVGFVLCLWRRNRLGVMFGLAALAIAVLFVHLPQGRLWNARMLPFYYLSLYFLCALAVYEAVRLLVEKKWARWYAVLALGGVVVIEVLRRAVDDTSWELRVARILPGELSTTSGALLVTGLATLVSARRSGTRLVVAPIAGAVWILATLVPDRWGLGSAPTDASGFGGFVDQVVSAAQQVTVVALNVGMYAAAYALVGIVLVEALDLVTDTDFVVVPQTGRVMRWASAPIVFLAIWLVFGLSLRKLPGGHFEDGKYRWGLPGLELSTSDRSFLDGWAEWNFRGIEEKVPTNVSGGYPEYRELIRMAEQVGEEHGCGRAMWEYEHDRLQGYGTPMAPMLLPHFTDGCIGSMEGLYFEASSTTPFHFLNQSALSRSPSSAQRELPYPGFDIDLGVEQLQMLGVRYYLAQTPEAVKAAREHPDLTEVAVSSAPGGGEGPWHMFLVADSEIVEPLRYSPVVYENVAETQDEWLQPAAAWFNDPSRWDVLRAASGPDDWPRYRVPETAKLSRRDLDEKRAEAEERGETLEDPTLPEPERVELPEVEVRNIEVGRDTLEFDVDQVGVPVLVKISYFPNWKADGADGPYRVTPNLMVVVPTDTHVRLHYGYIGIDYVSYALTGIGIVALVLLFRAAPAAVATPWWDPLRQRRREERPVFTFDWTGLDDETSSSTEDDNGEAAPFGTMSERDDAGDDPEPTEPVPPAERGDESET